MPSIAQKRRWKIMSGGEWRSPTMSVKSVEMVGEPTPPVLAELVSLDEITVANPENGR